MNWKWNSNHLDCYTWRRRSMRRRLARRFLCCLCFCLVVAALICGVGSGVGFFSIYSPEVPSATVEIGGNVPVLLDSAGFDPFWFDQVQVTLANLSRSTINITLFSGFCGILSTNSAALSPRKFSFNASNESRLPFNYYGGDTPVYSAGDKDSFISINTSAEAEGYLPCGIRLVRFSNVTSYVNFLNEESTSLSYNIIQQDTRCIPVGPPGLPLTSSVTFYLDEPGFYWQAMIVNSSVLINTTVSGIVSFYNTSFLGSVFCNFTHNCSIRISMVPSTPNQHVCVLALSDTLITVMITVVCSMWNIGTVITASAVLSLSVLLCCCCCCCFWYMILRHMSQDHVPEAAAAYREYRGYMSPQSPLISSRSEETSGRFVLYRSIGACTDISSDSVASMSSFRSEASYPPSAPDNSTLPMYYNELSYHSLAPDNSSPMYHESSYHLSTPDNSTPMYHDPASFRTLNDFKFDKTGLKCHLSDHGITVIIPENAINEDEEALLHVGVYYVDLFHFPEGYRLVSEVFWIDSLPLHKNVSFYMPHFVKIENKHDTRKLKFFLASDKSFWNDGVFKFTDAAPNHQYSFEPDGCYGKLDLNHFCSGCILEKIDSNDLLPLEYLVTSVLPTNRDRPSWTAEFVFSYALPVCQKVVVSQYDQNEYKLKSYRITFLESPVTLMYNFQPSIGWMIDQEATDKHIAEEDIDYRMLLTQKCSGDFDEFWRNHAHKLLKQWEDMKQYPPRLSLEILRTQQAQEPLRTDVKVNGVKPELKIRVIAPPYSAGIATQVLSSNDATAAAAAAAATTTTTTTTIPKKERDQFLCTAMLALQDHVEDWFTFGLHLGVDVHVLNRLNRSYLTHLDYRNSTREMLTAWTEKYDREATWEKIVAALRKIDKNALARQVEEQYIQPSAAQ